MTKRNPLVHVLSLTVVVVVVAVGCNGLLGNEEGTLRRESDGGAAALEAGADAAGHVCDTAQGNKVCFGLCVRIDQPNTGCGGTACAACDPKNVVMTTCKGSTETLACGYDACKLGFESCDGQDSNGCETSLVAKNTCGSCTTTCEGATPFCALTNGGYGCVASCPPGTQDCSGACVDISTSIDNCGRCGNKCSRASATATCVQSSCSYECTQGTHACQERCVSNLDPDYCGAACIACPPARPGMVRTCEGDICGAACAQGFLECNGDLFDGCEFQGNSCPLVGACDGQACGPTQKCCNKSCVNIGEPCILPPPPSE